MAISIGCLNSAEYNMVAGCCCDVACSISTGSAADVSIENIEFSLGDFVASNLLINGDVPRFPYSINNLTPLNFSFTVCAPNSAMSQLFDIIVTYDGGQTEFVEPQFNSITNELFNGTLIDFGTIAVGQSTGTSIALNSGLQPLLCCVDLSFSSIDAPFSTTFASDTLCDITPSTLTAYFQPTSIGTFNGTLTLQVNECNQISIPLVGVAIEYVPGGNSSSGNKKTGVDCPSGDCRLFNPQPGFAQKTKNTINQISRFTAPKGGPGRGTNFRK